MAKLVVRNGKIVDGAGNPWFESDLEVSGQRILHIGKPLPHAPGQ